MMNWLSIIAEHLSTRQLIWECTQCSKISTLVCIYIYIYIYIYYVGQSLEYFVLFVPSISILFFAFLIVSNPALFVSKGDTYINVTNTTRRP